jgi:hypothetical protein
MYLPEMLGLDQEICSSNFQKQSTYTGVDLRKKINWRNGPVKFLNNWSFQNSTGPRNIGPRSGPI